MINQKKIDFLIKQGFDKNVIKLLVDCGVEKHIMWFLAMIKKGAIDNINENDIKIINFYFEKTAASKVKSMEYLDALSVARKFEQNEKRKLKNQIYHFKNGFYISILNPVDLREEGVAMSNCVGTYEERVSLGIVGLLALKQPSGKTVAHIEIKKNGLIGQNYAKANTRLGKESWMMILEFFEKHSKLVDLSKLFGESYVVTYRGGNIDEIILSIPTSVNIFVENGIKKIDQINGFEAKRFAPDYKLEESAIKITSQSDVAEWVESKKREVIKSYDELIVQILATTASKLFLSDNIKERIFGSKKNSYLLKGENYNLSEIDPNHGDNREEVMAPALEEPYEPEERDIPLNRLVRNVAARQQRIRENIVQRDEPGEAPMPGRLGNPERIMEAPINEGREAFIWQNPLRGVAVEMPDGAPDERREGNVVLDGLQNEENQMQQIQNQIIEQREILREQIAEAEALIEEQLKEKGEEPAVVEIPFVGGYEATVEDDNGQTYGIVEFNEDGEINGIAEKMEKLAGDYEFADDDAVVIAMAGGEQRADGFEAVGDDMEMENVDDAEGEQRGEERPFDELPNMPEAFENIMQRAVRK